MLVEVNKKQFEASCKSLKADAVILAQYALTPTHKKHRTVSAPPDGSPPGTPSETKSFYDDVPEQVARVVVLTAAGEMVYQPTELFEKAFVTGLLPAAVLVGSIHG